MTSWPEQLYRLLPAVHQIRDGDRGEPLRQFLAVIGEQVQLIDDDIGQLYDNWFIETCQDWVVPYLGDLVGHRRPADSGHPSDVPRGQALNRSLYPRREIANLVRRRRRKGTLSVLEDLARDVTEWRARAVEFGRLVPFFQHARHPQAQLGRTVDVRCPQDNIRLNTPFDRVAHTVDVKQIASLPGFGWYSPNKVGLFVWRRKSYSATRVTPCRICTRRGKHVQAYTFNRLGLRQALYVNPANETEEFGQADERHVSVPLYRHLLRSAAGDYASDDYYGKPAEGKPRSLAIYVKWKGCKKYQRLTNQQVRVRDLSRECCWRKVACHLRCDQVAVDPECGLMLFKPHAVRAVEVTYHYSFSKDMGGGEYPRQMAARTDWRTIRLQQDEERKSERPLPLLFAVEAAQKREGGSCGGTHTQPLKSVVEPCPPAADECCTVRWKVDDDLCVEIIGSGSYEICCDETLTIAPGKTLEIRAASGSWPLVRIRSDDNRCGSPWRVLLGKGSRLILDGLQICGATLLVEENTEELPCQPSSNPCEPYVADDPCCSEPVEPEDNCPAVRPAALIVRHSTFVPGGRASACTCRCQPNHASIAMRLVDSRLVITDSIVGTLSIENPECYCNQDPTKPVCPYGPVALFLADSILDAAYGRPALLAECCFPAHADATFERTTVLGDVCAQQMSRAEDSLFAGIVHVQRRSHGYMRFCYVPLKELELPALDDGETCNRFSNLAHCLAEYDQAIFGGGAYSFDANCCAAIRTPPRFKCVPERKMTPVNIECAAGCGQDTFADRRAACTTPLVPKFVSTRYGDPGYCALALDCPRSILRGAEDESELGAFHDLYHPQRSAALAARLQEYTPVDFEAAVIYADDLDGRPFGCGNHFSCCSTE